MEQFIFDYRDYIFYGIIFTIGAIFYLKYVGFFDFLSSTDRSVMLRKRIFETTIPGAAYAGKLAGYDYSFIAGVNGRGTAVVILNKSVDLHIVAVGKKSGFESKLLKFTLTRHLQRVTLEGDFPKYFTMYCSKGREQELLELFDPADMARFADFCQAYDFELFDYSIYISKAAGAHDPNDDTSITADAETFLKKNKRWLDQIQKGNS